jgi:hypothetical protein
VVGIGRDECDEVIDGVSDGKAGPDGPALSPLRAFLGLAIAAGVAGTLVVAASRPDSPADSQSSRVAERETSLRPTLGSSPPGRESEVALTDDEAEAIFRRLRRRLERAYRKRSIELLRETVEPGSPQFAQSGRDLRFLARNNLLDRTRTRTLRVTVTVAGAERIVVRERAVVRPRYLDDATYVEVKAQLRNTRARSEWTLEMNRDRWMITSSRVSG